MIKEKKSWGQKYRASAKRERMIPSLCLCACHSIEPVTGRRERYGGRERNRQKMSRVRLLSISHFLRPVREIYPFTSTFLGHSPDELKRRKGNPIQLGLQTGHLSPFLWNCIIAELNSSSSSALLVVCSQCNRYFETGVVDLHAHEQNLRRWVSAIAKQRAAMCCFWSQLYRNTSWEANEGL